MNAIGQLIAILILGALVLIGLGTVGGWIARGLLPQELRDGYQPDWKGGPGHVKAPPRFPNGRTPNAPPPRPPARPSPPPPPPPPIAIRIMRGERPPSPETIRALVEAANAVGTVGGDAAARAEQMAYHAKALLVAIESDNIPRPKVHAMIWRAVSAASYPRDVS